LSSKTSTCWYPDAIMSYLGSMFGFVFMLDDGSMVCHLLGICFIKSEPINRSIRKMEHWGEEICFLVFGVVYSIICICSLKTWEELFFLSLLSGKHVTVYRAELHSVFHYRAAYHDIYLITHIILHLYHVTPQLIISIYAILLYMTPFHSSSFIMPYQSHILN